jgi:hypothetical protein
MMKRSIFLVVGLTLLALTATPASAAFPEGSWQTKSGNLTIFMDIPDYLSVNVGLKKESVKLLGFLLPPVIINDDHTFEIPLSTTDTTTLSIFCAQPSTGLATGGTGITIFGTGFVDGATVEIGGNSATDVTVLDSFTITATAPPAPALYACDPYIYFDIIVTNPGLSTVTSSGGFAFVDAYPVPRVTGIQPYLGPIIGGTPITITGSGFLDSATVEIDGSAADSVTVVNDTTITAITPPDLPGGVDVVVTNPGGGFDSLLYGFTYQLDAIRGTWAMVGPVVKFNLNQFTEDILTAVRQIVDYEALGLKVTVSKKFKAIAVPGNKLKIYPFRMTINLFLAGTGGNPDTFFGALGFTGMLKQRLIPGYAPTPRFTEAGAVALSRFLKASLPAAATDFQALKSKLPALLKKR